MKSFFNPLIAVACAVFVAGCPAPAPPAADNTAAPEKKLKVALLTPGDINDAGWNQLAYEGLQAVEKELGAQVLHQVTKNAADFEPAMNDFGDQKFSVVFCHGGEFGKHVLKVAPRFPNTKFVIVAGNDKHDPNVATLVPKLEEATYLLGMAAGGMTKTNVVGCIGGMQLSVITSTFLAFEQGVKAVNPKAVVKMTYVGNFEDQNKGKELAKSLVAQKCDVLFHNADQAGKGMFDAASEAKGVWVFGSNRNQNEVAPKICLGSAVIEMPHAFVDIARKANEGRFKADLLELNIASGDISVQWNAALKSKIPPTLLKKIEEAELTIRAGKLKIKRNV